MGFWDVWNGGGGGGLIPNDITLHHKDIAPIDIQHVNDVGPVDIEHVKDVEVQRISPVAAHIKEINHIDPLQVDGFNVSEVRNIDPLRVQQFNVTNIPLVNHTVRQVPPIDVSVRRVPPLSVGLHQNFRIPSQYTVSTRVLGIEVMRVTLQGESCVIPQDKFHREQARSVHWSQAQPAVAGNPAIPAHHRMDTPGRGGADPGEGKRMPPGSGEDFRGKGEGSLRVGQPGS